MIITFIRDQCIAEGKGRTGSTHCRCRQVHERLHEQVQGLNKGLQARKLRPLNTLCKGFTSNPYSLFPKNLRSLSPFPITQRLAGKLVLGLWSNQLPPFYLINLLNSQVSASPFSIRVQSICTLHYSAFI